MGLREGWKPILKLVCVRSKRNNNPKGAKGIKEDVIADGSTSFEMTLRSEEMEKQEQKLRK